MRVLNRNGEIVIRQSGKEKDELDTGRDIVTNQPLLTNNKNIYALDDITKLPNGKLYVFIKPICLPILRLANYLSKHERQPWTPPEFNPSAKVENLKAAYPYLL